MQSKQFEIGLSTFERIRAAFPALAMKLDLHSAHLALSMDIPAQPGLCFNVDLNLQNRDELHLVASALWIEWFPCTNPERVDEYFEAVSGLLSGRFRIFEYWRGDKAVKAPLQRPGKSGWNTIATSSKLLSVPWPQKSFKVVLNVPPVGPLPESDDQHH